MGEEMERGQEGKTGRENDEGKGAYGYFFFPTSSTAVLLCVLHLSTPKHCLFSKYFKYFTYAYYLTLCDL